MDLRDITGIQPGVVTIGIAAMAVSDRPGEELVTHGLGSCVAVLVHDPVRAVGGMLHVMLPAAAGSPQKARENPLMFADSGVPLLFHALYAKGCRKRDLVVKLVGGGSFLDPDRHFDIGQLNCTMLRTLLRKAGVPVRAEDVGGTRSRTVRMWVGTGRVQINTQGTVRDL